ncbi:MAG: F0F1 ATP synthase subunit A [Deltaproteobacteria bacterium]|nr:F0F1 ATP synthase subunit A [Deltaproteobacteria bacterium]
MPEHTSFLSYFVHSLPPAVDHNVAGLKTFIAHEPVNRYGLEPLIWSVLVMVAVIIMALVTRAKIANVDAAVVPERSLSIRTVIEVLIESLYNLMKEMMGAKRAKRYLPLIGTCGVFIFFSNIISLIPGLSAPTSSLNITFGCALFVFVAYNYYGFKENGVGYLKHFTGPVWWLAWLIGPIEIISNLIRPITLAVRLMLNMAVDHLVLGLIVAMIPLIVPIPLMMLGTLVAVVQTLVFCLLSSIYVSMATEHEH